MSEPAKDVDLMRGSLKEIVSGSLKDSHAGLLLQRGLQKYDAASEKQTKSTLIKQISNIKYSDLYKLAYERWEKITTTSPRFAQTAAKIVGRLYTGLGVGTALETHLTTHHTYGMPMLAGSSVKGAVAAYAEKIGLPEKVRAILFGDDKNKTIAGAVVWHDAWWIPNTFNPFVGEIVTTHHQHYYNGKDEKGKAKLHSDEMESPVPNQQIACQGSFYFVVECDNPSWAIFANQLLFETLQNQGLGSKTASGYGYFVYDESEQKKHDDRRAEQVENIEKQKRAAELAALPEHERLIQKWLDILNGQKFSTSDADGTAKYNELKDDLNQAIEKFDENQKKEVAEKLAFKSVLQNKQPKWLEGKREKEIKPLLAKLRGE